MDHAVQTLLDKQAIYELSCRYMRGLDRLDADSLLSVFWEDAYCEYGFMNGDAPTFIVFAISALRDHASNQHMIGNTLIEVEGDGKGAPVVLIHPHKRFLKALAKGPAKALVKASGKGGFAL